MQPLIGEELRRSDDPSRRAELVPELGFEQYAQLFDDVAALCREKVVLLLQLKDMQQGIAERFPKRNKLSA
jgi:hypothetical protein